MLKPFKSGVFIGLGWSSRSASQQTSLGDQLRPAKPSLIPSKISQTRLGNY